MVGYGYETYGELQPWVNREWLQTNGTGAFASSTVVGASTRRYHGLLVASTLPPVGRIVALNRMSETLQMADGSAPIELGVNFFRSTIVPRGDRLLRSFAHDITTRWHFDAGGISIHKEVLLCWGRNICGIRYRIEPPPGTADLIDLTLQPFVTLRDFHTLMHADGHCEVRTESEDACLVQRWGHQLHMQCAGTTFSDRRDWWYSFSYPAENERGQEDTEDLFTPGTFSTAVSGATTLIFWAGLEPLKNMDWDAEHALRKQQLNVEAAPTPSQQRLRRAANDFIVIKRRDEVQTSTTILAGYHWFGEWGRDTCVALPGLLLYTGRHHQAGQVLSTLAEYVSQGMIPHVFDERTGDPIYNCCDASLWYIHAVFEYLRHTKDQETFDSILQPACRQIVDCYVRGTRFGIKADSGDGLLSQGDPTTQLTWMDSKTNGVIFTPRHGKAVEINALWYNALRLMGEDRLADKVADGFRSTFYISPYRGCADVSNETGRDDSIRPNQILAVALPHSPLHDDQQQAVVEVVRRELLTPFGLRTLSPSDPKFQPRYTGVQFERDRAYHNGAIWPWLIGPFLDAYLRVNRRSPDAVSHARRWLQPLIDSLDDGCIGSINECYEAIPPHRPIAACAQAWSVAEVLRLAIELDM